MRRRTIATGAAFLLLITSLPAAPTAHAEKGSSETGGAVRWTPPQPRARMAAEKSQ